MIQFFISYIFYLAAISAVVGIAFFAIFGHRLSPFYSNKVALLLLCVFAFLDYYDYPMLAPLQLSMTIGNEALAEFIDMKGPLTIEDLYSFDFSDILIWYIQALIAYYAGSKIYWRLKAKLAQDNRVVNEEVKA